MRIFLIGLTGSGKTTLGKQLATQLKVPFVDLDEYIVEKMQCTIAEVFAEKGEDYFRVIEAECLREICGMKEAIISTGGGAACFHDNMTVMNISGITLFLDVPIQTISQRLWNQPRREQRPLIANKTYDELVAFLSSLFEKRLPFYSEAKITIQGDDINVWKILDCLNELD